MGVDPKDYENYKKRILSVLEIKKMFPVAEGQYEIVDLDTPSEDINTEQRRILMQKEYFFCRRYMKAIETKAKTIYNKQIDTKEIQPFYCDYRKLEIIAQTYNQQSIGDNSSPTTADS